MPECATIEFDPPLTPLGQMCRGVVYQITVCCAENCNLTRLQWAVFDGPALVDFGEVGELSGRCKTTPFAVSAPGNRVKFLARCEGTGPSSNELCEQPFEFDAVTC